MAKDSPLDWKVIIDREMLTLVKKCTACGRRFNLGESAVLAEGAWAGPPRWIHEEEAAFDRKKSRYVERGSTENTA